MVAIIPLLILSASIGCSVNAAPSSANAPISLPGYNAPSNTYRILDDSTSSKSDVAFRAGDDTDTDGDGIPDYENSPTIIDDDTAVEAAKAYVAGKTTTPVKDIALMSIVKSPHNGITHVHLVETHNSLQIANLVSNVNVCSKTGAIVSAGLIEMERKPAEKPPSRYGLYRRSTVSSTQAVEIAAKALGYDTKGLSSSLKVSGDGVITGAPFAIGDIIFSEKYYLTASAKLEKVWDLQIRHTNGWHNLFVSVESGDVIGSASWTAKDSFDVADDGSSDSSSSSNPFGMSDEENRESIFPEAAESDNDVEDRQASRTDDTTSSANDKKKPIATISAVPITFNSILDGSEKFINPGLIDVSVDGWFGNPTTKGELELRGNNIHVVDGQGKSAVSRNGGKFDRVYNTKLDAADPNNREAAMTNVFFISNLYHDIMYKYGFTEKSSNFQNNTFTRGGQGNDAITSYVQSDDGANNAFFMTPPDGNPGVMTFLFWSDPGDKVRRDSAVDNNIVIHELTHGLSNRLTGGKGISNCLQATEANGMGEGWSDTLAWWAVTTSSMKRTKDLVVGAYATNSKKGIRSHPYSTNMKTNPLTYESLKTAANPHAIGTVWSTMLYEVYWNMVDKTGFEKNKLNVKSGQGNIKFLQDVVDGMKLQPCNPTLVAARDSIIAADKRNSKGKFVCSIWRGFAKRGLGAGAKAGEYTNSFTLGDGCKPK